MKKMILATIALVSLTTISNAQFRVGVKAGGNISKQRVNVSSGNSVFSNDNYKSYHAGLITEVKLANRFYVQPQLLYTRKGSTLLSSTGAADAKLRIHYLEMPVNLVYKVPVSFGYLFGGAGAAFSYGISGKQTQASHSSSIFDRNQSWRREDVSLSFTAGVEMDNGLFVSINSQKGLLDVNNAPGISVKNSAVSVSLGYMIDWKQLKRKG
jgi:hypothetical protein